MGVAQLWKTLRDAGCVQDFAGATLDVPRDVDGKVVAVDASVWIMEASQQGLPVVQAPGEAEAMCAALNAAGLVDAVQTKDVDALLFGATTVYRNLHLQVTSQSQCQLSRCELAAWRDALGLATGGTLALRCVSVL
ncbi:uncharacterized protein HaLaN_23093, partial [Haematococcus lacustris]